MLLVTWSLLVAVVFLFFYYFDKIRTLIKQRRHLIELVDRIPGPTALPLIGCAYQFKWKPHEFAQQFEDWAREFGPNGYARFWVGPIPLIFVVSTDALKAILTSTKLLTKSTQYDIILPWLGEGLLISTGDKWQRRRKMLTPTFHFNILNGFADIFAREAQILAEQLAPFADTNEAFDIFPFLKRCTLDIICETSMGTKVDAQIHHDSDYVIAVERLTELVWENQRLPWLQLKPIWYMSGLGFDYDRQVKLVSDFTRKVTAERAAIMRTEMDADEHFASNGRRKKCLALLDLLLLMQKENTLTEEDIREEVDTFMFEGHGTTSSGLGWTIWRLGHEPEIQDKIVAELDEIFGDSDRLIETEDLRRMRYLERVVKESLRMYPPVPLFARVVTEDVVLERYTLPRGSTVVIAPGVVHRDPEFYPNPDVFDPDNFLPERVAKRDPYAYLPFSAGQRNCIGQKFALMEEKTVLATVLRKYRIVSVESIEDCKPQPEMVLKPPKGFDVMLFSRTHSS